MMVEVGRVLWCAVKAIQEGNPNLDIVIYIGDHDATPETLMIRAIYWFGVKILQLPQVVHLYRRKWIEERTYPHFTMVGQSFGSVYLAWEALCKIANIHCHFILILVDMHLLIHLPGYLDAKLFATHITQQLVPTWFGVRVYTIELVGLRPMPGDFGPHPRSCEVANQTDHLDKTQPPGSQFYFVSSFPLAFSISLFSQALYNSFTCRSTWLSWCKVIYYTIFSWMYGFVGSYTLLAMVNSSWTQLHIEKLWGIPKRTMKVYPPCDTSGLQKHIVISSIESSLPKLQFVGSCRNKEDEDRLQKLKDKAIELKVEKDVEFYKNLMYRWVSNHFSFFSSAHNSASPKMDIVLEEDGNQTGFLASDPDEYANAIQQILRMPHIERLEMAAATRKRASRFSVKILKISRLQSYLFLPSEEL
ncbi:hypothetical protein IFM89_001790 [Coptis chinensis]|uniref:ALG11 mannosyltransferase N-terminal domain-containing protein n=1 Tax=Coptis chinensis TaxID=261450 RepID=A0A835LQH9_9MAGN|nr:hypothetical protein IFM89_001790 [Coptis chinensis]